MSQNQMHEIELNFVITRKIFMSMGSKIGQLKQLVNSKFKEFGNEFQFFIQDTELLDEFNNDELETLSPFETNRITIKPSETFKTQYETGRRTVLKIDQLNSNYNNEDTGEFKNEQIYKVQEPRNNYKEKYESNRKTIKLEFDEEDVNNRSKSHYEDTSGDESVKMSTQKGNNTLSKLGSRLNIHSLETKKSQVKSS